MTKTTNTKNAGSESDKDPLSGETLFSSSKRGAPKVENLPLSQQRCWLLKSEPSCYSIDELKRDKETYWDGVRNYQARNFMQKDMAVGDRVFFYHSNATPTGIAGIAQISRLAVPDFTGWDPKSDHFDPKAGPEHPIWWMVYLKYIEKFAHIIPLSTLHTHPQLTGMPLLQKGSRLSVQPVSPAHFEYICSLK